jgi:hypothetical protein
MSLQSRRGCGWLLVILLSALLLTSVVAGAGVMIGARQPSQVWVVPLGWGHITFGRIVSSNTCRRMQAQGILAHCPWQYGAVVFLRQRGAQGYGVEQTLFTIPYPLPEQ